ncbi:MAG: sigma-70 family RNA polymerase sigma factor [Burkholderiaceae bacterium]
MNSKLLPPAKSDARCETASLASLYRLWCKPLIQRLHRIWGSREQAEDAAQRVFTQMAASGKLPAPGKEYAYLRRAAGNLAIDGWRKNGGSDAIKTVSLESCHDEIGRLPAPAAHDPVEHTQRRQYLARLEQALGELPERQRQAFTLHMLDGLTQQEVAERMAISLRMVAKHVSRALAYCELRLQYGSLEQMQRLRTVFREDDDSPQAARDNERGSTR